MERKPETENFISKSKVKTYKNSWWRWWFLIVMNFVGLGYNFGNNVPSSLGDWLQHYWKMSIPQLNALNYIYAFPNTIIPVLGGIALDKFGLRKAAIIFLFVNFLGFGCWLIGAYTYEYHWLVVGQCVFALSGENTCILIAAWIGKWFPKEEQGIAQAINISFAHFWQAVLPGIVSIFWDDGSHSKIHHSMLIAMWLMLLSQVFSFINTIYCCYLDKLSEKEEKQLLENQQDDVQAQTTIVEEGGGHGGFQWSDLKQLGLQYWLLCFLLSFGYGGFNKFQTDFQQMVKVRYSIPTSKSANIQQVGLYMSIPILPLAGILVDRIGRRCELLTGSFVMIFAMYCMMYFSPVYYHEYTNAALLWVLIPQIFQGIAFGVFAAIIWSVFPLICEDKVLGTAFGIVDGLQSFIFGLFPFVLGPVFVNQTRKQAGNYIFFFVVVNAINILICIWIWVNDSRNGNKLRQIVNKGKKNKTNRTSSKGELRNSYDNQ